MRLSNPIRAASRIAIVAIACTLCLRAHSPHAQQVGKNPPALSAFEARLLGECLDFRLGFYRSWEELSEAKGSGSCLVVPDGVFAHAISFRTNVMPTVAMVLRSYATNYTSARRYRTKVVQRDAIFQTPIGAGAREEARAAVLNLKLEGGDIVILNGKF